MAKPKLRLPTSGLPSDAGCGAFGLGIVSKFCIVCFSSSSRKETAMCSHTLVKRIAGALALAACASWPLLTAIAAPSFKTLYTFTDADGVTFPSYVGADSSGAVYGVGYRQKPYPGCRQGCEVIFRITPPTSSGDAWSYEQIALLKQTEGPITVTPSGDVYLAAGKIDWLVRTTSGQLVSKGQFSCGGVVVGKVMLSSDGSLYWIEETVKGGGRVYKYSAACSLLHVFPAKPPNGIAIGDDGSVYGTIPYFNLQSKSGVVFKISHTGQYSELYTFDGTYIPNGHIFVGKGGMLYGLADLNTNKKGSAGGSSIVWSLSTASTFAQIATTPFNSPPVKDLTMVGKNLWGVGGPGFQQDTLFKLSPPATGSMWKVTIGHRFSIDDPSGGFSPDTLTFNGNSFYGFTERSGSPPSNQHGTIFSYGPFTPAVNVVPR